MNIAGSPLKSFQIILRLICVTIISSSSLAIADNQTSPAPIRDLYPLTSMHYTSTPRSAYLTPVGDSTLTTSFIWSNTNAIRPGYTIDAETRELRLSLRHGITQNTEVFFELPVLYRGGGMLDSFIDSWHNFWNLPRGRRKRVNDDSFQIVGETDSGERFSLENDGTGPGNSVIGLSRRLFTNNNTTLLVNGTTLLSLPTSLNSLGHSGVDSFTTIHATYTGFNNWSFHMGAGLLFIGDTEVSKIQYKRWRGEHFASMLYSISESLTVGSSATYSSEIVENIKNHPDYSAFVDFEASLQISKKCSVQIAIREELVSGNGSQDVGLFTSVNYLL